MMTSLSAPKLVRNIFTRTFVIPNDVVFIYFRQTNGERYITCIPFGGANNRPLFISVAEFIKIIDTTEAWIKAKYVSSDGSPPGEISTRGDSGRGYNRIEVVFTASDNVKSIDVRNYWKPLDAVTFARTCIGFTVHSSENITALVKIKNELTSHLKEVGMLEDLIHIAHGVIYEIYKETCGLPYNAIYRSALTTISKDTFTSLWTERMHASEPVYAEEWIRAASDIYTYILSKGVESLEKYKELAQFIQGTEDS